MRLIADGSLVFIRKRDAELEKYRENKLSGCLRSEMMNVR